MILTVEEAKKKYCSLQLMEAGPALDALVAEKVMGLNISAHLCWEVPGGDVPGNGPIPCIEGQGLDGDCTHLSRGGSWNDCKSKASPEIPPYSTDISAAWEVVESRKQPVWSWVIQQSDSGEWWAEIRLGYITSFSRAIIGRAPTIPLAICRASLLSVLEEKE